MLTIKNVVIQRDTFELSANFTVPDGVTKLAMVGPSGAGKSTLLGAIGGFVPLDQGRISWEGRDLTEMPPVARPMSHLFQDNNLFPHMTAAQNVGLGIAPNLKLSPQDWERVENALAAVGIGGMGGKRPAQLSGGQQSRVALARILVQRQPIVLLDEPFSALGPAMRVEMTALASKVGTGLGATMLMVSHDLADARRFADYVIWVDTGTAHAPQSWEELEAEPPAGYRAYVGDG
ncbi:ATP-binding cassette domain-containing protein [Celeribacter sp.]|uniref:thiamine ABC transporter ATP-binding protein n=1 Tax=Celeribacter sp. TaxID=1890673 RepID=UPI003A93CB3B